METTNTAVEQPKAAEVRKLFPTKAAYLAMRTAWANSTQTGYTDKVLLYNLLRGLDPKRGFTAATNKRKLENGYRPNYAFECASSELKWKISRWLDKPETVDHFTKKAYKEMLQEYLTSSFGSSVTIDILKEALKGLN